jgi:hypothetical protein
LVDKIALWTVITDVKDSVRHLGYGIVRVTDGRATHGRRFRPNHLSVMANIPVVGSLQTPSDFLAKEKRIKSVDNNKVFLEREIITLNWKHYDSSRFPLPSTTGRSLHRPNSASSIDPS